jgi:hypothetical protein
MEELTKPDFAEIIGKFVHEHEPSLAGAVR